MRRHLGLVLLPVAILLVAACSDDDDPGDPAPSSSTTTAADETTTTTGAVTTTTLTPFPPERRTLDHGGEAWGVVLAAHRAWEASPSSGVA